MASCANSFRTISTCSIESERSEGDAPWSARSAVPARSELARQLGLTMAREPDISEDMLCTAKKAFSKHQEDRTIAPEHLPPIMQEVYGRGMKNAELEFVLRSCRADTVERLPKFQVLEAIRALELYKRFAKDLHMMFYLFDARGCGELGLDEVKLILHELHGKAMGEEDTDKVLAAVDTNNDGRLSRLEFCMMVAHWPARARCAEEAEEDETVPDDEEEEAAGACTLM